MEKGISFFFGYKSNPKERAQMLKNIGFDNVITSFDKKFYHQNGNIKQQISFLKDAKLGHSSLHMRYDATNLPNFWKHNFRGFLIEKNLIKDVKFAKKYGFRCVVVHLVGAPNLIGQRRLERVLKVCEKTNIDLAIENINDNRGIKYVLKNMKHPNLKFCYDSGHHNVWDKDFDFLSAFGNNLVALHLHDNDSKNDQHTLNKYGTINWQKLAEKLAKVDHEIYLDYEIFMKKRENETEEEVAKTVFNEACELEKMIENSKNKLYK